MSLSFLLPLLVACGTPEPTSPAGTQPVPDKAAEVQAPPPAPPPAPPTCSAIITSNDASAMFSALSAIKVESGCKFEDLHTRGWVMELTFLTVEQNPVKVTMEPSACIEPPEEGQVKGDTYTLTGGVADAKTACPKAIQLLIGAVKKGELPPPSEP